MHSACVCLHFRLCIRNSACQRTSNISVFIHNCLYPKMIWCCKTLTSYVVSCDLHYTFQTCPPCQVISPSARILLSEGSSKINALTRHAKIWICTVQSCVLLGFHEYVSYRVSKCHLVTYDNNLCVQQRDEFQLLSVPEEKNDFQGFLWIYLQIGW